MLMPANKGWTRLETGSMLSRITNWLENPEHGIQDICGENYGIG
jgi:hypothetical protein